MALKTRLTERLGLTHPIVSAPMAHVAGGALAAAVSRAGGLGMIGGGYGEDIWLEHQFELAGKARVGCGFITWSLARRPFLLDLALDRFPVAVMLSYGDPQMFSERILSDEVTLICQVQTLEMARGAIAAGADILVAQGAEAGGHGMARATMTLVPEIADLLARSAPDTLLLAAGGIADGRGLAAALLLGADGVLMGSRFFASREALVHDNLRAAALAADGDATLRTGALDRIRGLPWPEGFTARVLRNDFIDKWQAEAAALSQPPDGAAEAFFAGTEEGDAGVAGVFVGEGTGLIRDIVPAGELVARISQQAEHLLVATAPGFVL
ncbi:MAG TPA: nitronate monooxygenase [Hyphomicrobiales bacterium]|nr:nitronate monooxygenase [Hyphomicrobiales bacterium]